MPEAGAGLLRRNPAFRWLWSASVVSLLGDRFSLFAVPALALTRLHAPASVVALLFALQALPGVLLALPAAAHLVGRSERAGMIAADLTRAGVLGLVAGLAFAGRLPVWLLLACVVVIGVANTLFDVASQVCFPAVVDAADYTTGNTRLSQASSAAAVAGPVLTGALIGGCGPVWPLLVDAVSFVASCAMLTRVRRPAPVLADKVPADRAPAGRAPADGGPAGQGPPPGGPGWWAVLTAGWRLVWSHPGLRAITVSSALFNLGGAVISSLWFAYLLRVLRLAPGLVGVLSTVGGVSALATTLGTGWVVRRAGPRLALTGALLAAVAAIWLIPLSARGHPAALLAVYQLAFSAAAVVFGVVSATVRQSITTPEYQGRVFAVAYTFAMASLPLGGVLGSVVATAASPVAGLVVGAGIVTVSVLSVRALAHAADPAHPPGAAAPVPGASGR